LMPPLLLGSLRFARPEVTGDREGLGRVRREGVCRLAGGVPPSASWDAGIIAAREPAPRYPWIPFIPPHAEG